VSAAKLVRFLQSYLNDERVIFLSSHDLSYSQKVITHLGILEGGTLQFVGPVEEFAESKDSIEESILRVLQPKETTLHELEWLVS
jgi:ABC-type multidrug transport system ATPase subunit